MVTAVLSQGQGQETPMHFIIEHCGHARQDTMQLVDKVRQDLAERGGQPAQAHDQGQQGQQQAPDEAQAQDEKMKDEMGQAHPGQQEG